jgi:hypothetical protein
MNWLDSFMDWSIAWVMGPLMVILTLALGAAMFIGIPWGIYAWITYTPSETFTLRFDQWACTEHVTRDVTTHVLVGKVLVPTTSRQRVCTQWSEK